MFLSFSGEDCRSTTTGIYFMNTNPNSPFALGRITDLTRTKNIKTISFNTVRNTDPFLKEIDTFGKLEGNFNNLPFQKPLDDGYFTNHGSAKIAQNFVNHLRHQSDRTKNSNGINIKVRKSSKLLMYDNS